MNYRENVNAILHYQPFEKMPIVSFGYWGETVQKWADEGHITREEADGYCRYGDNSEADRSIMKRLGFDFNWNSCYGGNVGLYPAFERKVLEQKADGGQVIRDEQGLIVLVKPGVVSIPAEIGTTLTDRECGKRNICPGCNGKQNALTLPYLNLSKMTASVSFRWASTAAPSWVICAICWVWKSSAICMWMIRNCTKRLPIHWPDSATRA